MLSREEIMQQMEQKIKDCNTTKYWENTSKDFLDNEVFKQLHKIRNPHSRSNRNTKMLKFLFGCHIMKDFHRSIIDPIFNICDFFF